jgi:two-component system chemotaxis response regulator CheB
VDVAFASVAKAYGRRAAGLVLTGMGSDGAAGLLAMRQAGAVTMVQNEESCVVFGMPRAAIELGAADRVLSPAALVAGLTTLHRERLRSLVR